MKKEKSVKFTKSAEFFKNLQVLFIRFYSFFIIIRKTKIKKKIIKIKNDLFILCIINQHFHIFLIKIKKYNSIFQI